MNILMGPFLMARTATEAPLILPPRPPGIALNRWLYEALRDAILSGRLQRGMKIPATRSLAESYGISRRTAVNVYEQLREEGYLSGKVGAGTIVSPKIPEDYLARAGAGLHANEEPRSYLPAIYARPARAFRPIEPAISEFPVAVWARVAAKVMRRANVASLAGGDPAGLPILREAIAAYLGASRGLICSSHQIMIVSGAQQALDLLARILLRPGDQVWIEDPGYVGAVDAFRNAQAELVPVKVDCDGLDPTLGRRLCPSPRAVYLTPAHQFGLGVTLSLPRRLDLLQWARESQAILIEDDYDSEFRFAGRPVPALRGLQGAEDVFHIGTFNKVLFPALRLAYIVVPNRWMDALLALRFQTDRYPPVISQLVLAGFIQEGHFARHLRRMREIYGQRRAALQTDAERYLGGILELPEIAAGLNTPAYLRNGMDSREAADLASRHDVEVWPLDRFALRRQDLQGFVLGFAAFNEREIRKGVLSLAKALAPRP